MAASLAQSRVQNEAEKMLATVEKDLIRPMQREAHLCAAKCCENQSLGTQNVQNCISKCFVGVQQAQDYVNQEINNFQERLSRCAKTCQDQIQDKISVNTTHSEAGRLQEEMNACVDKCCDSHCELLPKMFERIKETLSSVQRPASI